MALATPKTLAGLQSLAEEAGWRTGVFSQLGEKNGKPCELTVLRMFKEDLAIAACWHDGRWDAAVCRDPLKQFNQAQLKKVLSGEEPVRAPAMEEQDDVAENIRWEREYLGAHISGHPLELTTVDLRQAPDTTAVVGQENDGRRVDLVGLVLDAEITKTRNGTPWAKFTVEDALGRVRAFAFGNVAEGAIDGLLARLEGSVVVRDDEAQLKIQKAYILEEW